MLERIKTALETTLAAANVPGAVAVVGNSSGRLLDEMVNKETCKNGWGTFTLDLTRFAGQEIQLRMWNQANDWAYEFAYWGSVRVVSE